LPLDPLGTQPRDQPASKEKERKEPRDCRFSVPIAAQLSARSQRAVHLLLLSEINRFRLGLLSAATMHDFAITLPSSDVNFDTERCDHQSQCAFEQRRFSAFPRAHYFAFEPRGTLASRPRRVSAIRMAAAGIKGDSCGRHFIEISSEATPRRWRRREEHCEPLGPSLPSSKPRGLPYIKVLFGSPFRYPYRDPRFWTRRSSSAPCPSVLSHFRHLSRRPFLVNYSVHEQS